MSLKTIIELPWVIVFAIIHMLPAMIGTLISMFILFPLVGWWNRKMWASMNCWIADIIWRNYSKYSIEMWGRSKYHFYGDPIGVRDQNGLLVSNHLTILDWALLFPLAGRKGRLGVLKFFAKKSSVWIPGMGWALFVLDSFLVAREWTKDRALIDATFATLKQRKYPFWVVSFLEGTRKTPAKLAAAQEYSREHNLPVLNNVLFPRTKGFVATIMGLRDEMKYVYDVTFAFNGPQPSISDLAMRRFPDLHFYVKRFEVKDLPHNEAAITKWCIDLWVAKDKLLEDFKRNGTFPRPQGPDQWSQPYKHEPIDVKVF